MEINFYFKCVHVHYSCNLMESTYHSYHQKESGSIMGNIYT